MTAAGRRSAVRRIYDLCCRQLLALDEFDKLFERPSRVDVPTAVAALLAPTTELKKLLDKGRPHVIQGLDIREHTQVFTAFGATTPDALIAFVERVAALTTQVEWRRSLSNVGERAHSEWCGCMQAFQSEHHQVLARIQLEVARLGMAAEDPPKRPGTKGPYSPSETTLSDFATRFRVPYSTLADRRARHNRRKENEERRIEPIDASRPSRFRTSDLERLLHASERQRAPDP